MPRDLDLLLLMPDAHMHKLRVGPFVRSMREAPLSLTTLAAVQPRGLNIRARIVDGSVDKIPLDLNPDLVGISAITGTANAAYRIADHYRSRNIPVVLGGVHPTILPGEAARHADSVVIGMAERVWPRLLEDFTGGRLARAYVDLAPPGDFLDSVPTPRRDLQRQGGYMMPNTVHATRGCKRVCDFCTVPAVWPRYFRRPVADVIADVRSIRSRYFCFNDVSLVDDPEYAAELFTALIPLGKKWGGLATVEVARQPDLLALMQKSGCVYLLLGFESLNQHSLKNIHKGFNKAQDYREVMTALHGHGITVQGCFVFGLDEDGKDVFDTTVQQVLDLKMDIPRYSIYTPYPGTELFARMMAEKRIVSFNWDDYDTMHAVHTPARMSMDELYAGFKWAYRETFRLGHIARRLTGGGPVPVINAIGNLAYRIFVHRLYHEKRFASPCSLASPGSPPEPGFWRDAFLAQGDAVRV